MLVYLKKSAILGLGYKFVYGTFQDSYIFPIIIKTVALKKYRIKLFWVVLGLALLSCKGDKKLGPVKDVDTELGLYQETHRPQFHFSPPENG